MSKYKSERRVSNAEDSYEDEYSDDFDDDADTNRRYKTSPARTGRGLLVFASGNRSRNTNTSRHTHTEGKVLHRSFRGRGRGRGGRGNSTGRQSQEPGHIDNITKRVLSARRLKINEMRNHNEELQQVIKDLKDENKLLKKTHLRHEKALQRFEDRESDLPQLIQRQNNEVRSYKDQIKKWREKFEKSDRYLRDAEDELEKTKYKLKKLKTISDEKELPERSDLNKKLTKSELEIEERDVKIRELEKHIAHLQKNHRHELGIEIARQKEVQKQLSQTRDEKEKLQDQVKEKDKELQMTNIYSNRLIKPPHRLPNSYSGTPNGTPPPARQRRPSLTDVTPRDKAKMYEDKRREEMRKQREIKQKKAGRGGGHHTSPRQQPNPYKQQEKVKREEELRKQEDQNRSLRSEEDRRRREREDEDRRDKEEQEWEEQQRRQDREEDEQRNRQDRDRMKQEAADREREQRLRKEQEERERREKREREERDRRERERMEQERRAREELERMEMDAQLNEERKKKDLILQKLREIDEGGAKPSKEKKSQASNADPFFVTNPRADSNDSLASSKKSYNFSKPIENMHKGKPSRGEASFTNSVDKKKQKSDVDGLAFGGYNPTFGSSQNTAGGSPKAGKKTFSLFDDDDKPAKKTETNRKSKLMDDLFGGTTKSDTKNDSDIFGGTQSKKSTTKTAGFPWDDDVKPKNSASMNAKRENSSTLFGGGSALINDDDFQTTSQGDRGQKSRPLPRRQKQTATTFSAKPTVTAIDHLDDEIEEVML